MSTIKPTTALHRPNSPNTPRGWTSPSPRPVKKRFDTNRITIYVWPPSELTDIAVEISYDQGMRLSVTAPTDEPIQPLDDYRQKVLLARRRGTTYPCELTDLLAGAGGTFTEYDLDDAGALVPVDRLMGQNKAGIVAGVVSTPTERFPEGVTRVVLLGDPTRALGARPRRNAHGSSPLSTWPSGCAYRSRGSRCPRVRGSP